MILIVDNIDSFTYNVAASFSSLGQEIRLLLRNDDLTDKIGQIHENIDLIVISPGPGNPETSGESLKIIKHYVGRIPIIGICLGFQLIAHFYGSKTKKAAKCVHGKTGDIIHKKSYYFEGIPSPFKAMRYNSLTIERDTLDNNLETIAWNENDETMAFYNDRLKIGGVQFHPDSYKTEYSAIIFQNMLKYHSKKP